MANLSNINNKFIVTDGGKALINATAVSTGATLTIGGGADGIATIVGGSDAARWGMRTDSHWVFLQLIESDGRFRFYNNITGGERLTILQNGNVGIGTDSPDEKLDVDGKVQVTGTSLTVLNASDPNVTVSDTDTNYKGAMRWLSSSNVLEFFTRYGGTYYTNNLVLDRGKVGIGTASPSKRLQVSDSATGDLMNILCVNTHDTDGDTASIGFSMVNLNYQKAAIIFERTTTQGRGSLHFATNNVVGNNNVSKGDARMTILSGGDVGIGTILPIEKLQVSGQIISTGSNSTLNTSGAQRAIMDLSGFSATDTSARFGHFRGATAAGAGQMRLYTDSVERVRIDASGNVGIGEDDPGYKLDVSGNIKSSTVTVYDGMGGTETGIGASGAGGYLRLYSAGVNRVTVESTARTLSVFGSDTVGSNFIQFYNSAGTAQGYIGMGAGATNDFIINCESSSVPMRFFNGGSERMRITSNGGLKLGMADWGAAPSSTIYGLKFETSATGKSYWRSYVNAATSHYHYEFGNTNGMVGNITSSGTAAGYNSVSDYRLKEDLQDFNGLDKVSKIPVYDFKWKSDETRSYGVMAHELQEVLPQAVSGEKDAEEMQGVDYSKIVPLLIKGMQEQQIAIQELKTEIDLLKNS